MMAEKIEHWDGKVRYAATRDRPDRRPCNSKPVGPPNEETRSKGDKIATVFFMAGTAAVLSIMLLGLFACMI